MINVSGFWEGSYVYPMGGAKVSFDADLKQSGSQLSGLITEPNTFDGDAGHVLTSVLAGSLSGDKVSFLKTYVGEGRAQHSVAYEGTLSQKGTKINGQWKIQNGNFSGLFEMTRLSGGADVLHKASEHIEI